MIATQMKFIIFQEGNMQRAESRMRNMTFRKNIRRAELDNYFQQRRSKLLQEIAAQENSFSIIFNSTIEQDSFLQECSLGLTGDPKPEWLDTIMRLRKAILSFQGDFERWFTYSIIHRLSQCLSVFDLPNELTDNVILIFIDMLYCSGPENPDFAPKLMDYEIVVPVLRITQDKSRPLLSRLNVIMLLSKLIYLQPKYRHQMIRDGAGSILVQQGSEILQQSNLNQQLAFTWLQACFGFLGNHKSMSIVVAYMNLIYSLLPYMLKLFLIERLDQRSLLLTIQNINFMLAVGKDQIYKMVYYWKGFKQRMFSLLYHQNQPKIRNCICFTIGHISFAESEQINRDLIEDKMFDHLYNSYIRFQSNNQTFVKNMINAVYNVMQNEANCQVVAYHNICGVIVSKFSKEEPSDLQYEAVFFINTLMQNLRYSLLEQLVKRYDIFMILARNLMDLSVVDGKIIQENLKTLIYVVRRSQEVYHGGDNPIVKNLESLYNLSETAENIRHNYRNRKVESAAEILLKTIQQAYLQNADTVI